MGGSVIKPGIVLGVLVVVWTFVMGFTGGYKNPGLAWLFVPVAALIQVVVLVWALRKTAAGGRGYAGQVAAGLLISVVAAVLIFLGSILFTTGVFPQYFEEVRAMGEQVLRKRGMSDEEVRTTLAMQAKLQTPFLQALFGVIGTVVTGLVASLVIAAFVRGRKPA
jgi:hypothetical protein